MSRVVVRSEHRLMTIDCATSIRNFVLFELSAGSCDSTSFFNMLQICISSTIQSWQLQLTTGDAQ